MLACSPTLVRVAGLVHPCGWQESGTLRWCIGLLAHTHRNVCGFRCRHRCGSACWATIVQLLPRRTAIAVALGLIREPLGTEERAVLSVDTVPSSHIGRDAPIRQPLQ